MKVNNPTSLTPVYTANNQKTLKSGVGQSATSIGNKSTTLPQVKTTEKTVHLKEIKQLDKKITSSIDKITQDIKKNHNKGLGGLFNHTSAANMSTQLNNLKQEIQDYQTKLDSSSYKHHGSKQTTLNKLENDINKIEIKVNNESKMQDFNKNQSEAKQPSLAENMQSRARRTEDFANYGNK